MDFNVDEDENQQIQSAIDLRKWRIELPNLIDDANLDVYSFRLLVHYYRVGNCWEGTRYTAKKCKMSVGKVVECRKILEDKGFISMVRGEPGESLKIQIIDIWDRNFRKYSSRKQKPSSGEKNNGHADLHADLDEGCSPHEQGVHHMNERINQLRINTFATAKELPSRTTVKPVRPKRSARDGRTGSPAIQAIFRITGRYPALSQYDVLIDILGLEPDIDKLKSCWTAWREEKPGKKPYSPFNYGWITDWYINGIPGRKEPVFWND